MKSGKQTAPDPEGTPVAAPLKIGIAACDGESGRPSNDLRTPSAESVRIFIAGGERTIMGTP